MIAYKLRPYTEADFEFVYQTKKRAYMEFVKKFWGIWDEKQQRSLFTDFIKKVQDDLLIVCHQNTPIGIYHGNRIDKNTYEIGNIIIVPEYQGKGIGKDILFNVIQSHFKSKISLRVFKDNSAIGLYKRLGFIITGKTRTHNIMEYKYPVT